MSNTTYIFYGLEIPKTWKEWPSAFGSSPRNVKYGKWEIDIPNIGGEPVLLNGKAVTVEGFELTLFRYPHDQEDVIGQDSLGILGFMVCEIHQYCDPTAAFRKYKEWEAKFATVSNFDVMIQAACKVLDFNYIEPGLWSCSANCSCCE